LGTIFEQRNIVAFGDFEEAVHVADNAGHVDIDDGFGFWCD